MFFFLRNLTHLVVLRLPRNAPQMVEHKSEQKLIFTNIYGALDF